MVGLPMHEFVTVVESRIEDPGHCEVFIIGHDPDEPGVLRA